MLTRWRLSAALTLIMTLAAGAAETEPSGGASVHASPAAPPQQDGIVRLVCTATADGHVTDCKVLSEKPAGQGYGDAALKLTGQFRMNPEGPNGQSVAGARITIPIRFKAGAPAVPAKP